MTVSTRYRVTAPCVIARCAEVVCMVPTFGGPQPLHTWIWERGAILPAGVLAEETGRLLRDGRIEAVGEQ